MIIPHVDEDLRIPLHGLVEDAEGAGFEVGSSAGGCVGGVGHDGAVFCEERKQK